MGIVQILIVGVVFVVVDVQVVAYFQYYVVEIFVFGCSGVTLEMVVLYMLIDL